MSHKKMPPQVVLMQLHTGGWGGTAVKIIYFLAALIGALLPWSNGSRRFAI